MDGDEKGNRTMSRDGDVSRIPDVCGGLACSFAHPAEAAMSSSSGDVESPSAAVVGLLAY